jgi:lipid II:glycine glycyltransferase (peptidoglycan interpeptide bridge formation enzyme)
MPSETPRGASGVPCPPHPETRGAAETSPQPHLRRSRPVPTGQTGGLAVRPIAPGTHLAFVYALAETDPVSFLQCPAWGAVKSGWTAESVGWYDGTELVGVATVLYRRAPWLERSLAYVPEGPVVDWYGERGPRRRLGAWLDPLAAHVRARGAFALRIGPPVIARSWDNATVKAGMADPQVTRFAQLESDRRDPRARDLVQRLAALGWQRADGPGLGDAQPSFHFRLPLQGRTETEVWDGFNSQWRRNVRIAERAGVQVERAGADALPEFHKLYLTTAARDGFLPRPLPYFERMFQSFDAEDPDRVRLYLARLDGEALAAATLVRVGSYAWFGYGASSDEKRDARPSNALQWRMVRDCLAEGVHVYDLRGIMDTLDAENRHVGLLRFKAGTGGEVVEYPGEWDLPLSRAFYKVFRLRAGWR